MSGWEERAAASLLPLSRSPTFWVALREWRYTGRFFDLENTDGTCELCSQRDLRYHFEIADRGTRGELLVGSECIKRFDLSGLDEEGREIDAADTARLVDRHRRGLVEDARRQRVMTALLKLGQATPDFDAGSFLGYVDDRGAFTPKQLAMIFWRLQGSAVPYRPSDFRLTIRRDREKAQLRSMPEAAYRRVEPAMTKAQRATIERIKVRFAAWGQSWR
ncbi:MAG TPA: hypothetical protein VF631_07650 [Allosphingosinicella sp.]|jgi:hypothetical protein|uniref:hypothetical protein n=1 Tax=Allosphingosinicella sp. TaxID=2823234 RepID=UPI002F272723